MLWRLLLISTILFSLPFFSWYRSFSLFYFHEGESVRSIKRKILSFNRSLFSFLELSELCELKSFIVGKIARRKKYMRKNEKCERLQSSILIITNVGFGCCCWLRDSHRHCRLQMQCEISSRHVESEIEFFFFLPISSLLHVIKYLNEFTTGIRFLLIFDWSCALSRYSCRIFMALSWNISCVRLRAQDEGAGKPKPKWAKMGEN